MDIRLAGPDLGKLRQEIDRIDAAMHALLIERGEIIDRLIAAKRTTESGSAFRPDREASMMKALTERHRGKLPPEAVEGLWRVIISTFTHLQAPFAAHVDLRGGAELRDSARFHFGFTVPCREAPDAAGVIAAVAASRGDVGLLPVGSPHEAWWRALEDPAAPKVIARLPFVDRAGHPAGLPVLVIASVEAEAGPAAIRLYSATSRDPDLRLGPGFDLVARVADDVLVGDRDGRPVEAVEAALAAVGLELRGTIGRHPVTFRAG